MADGSTADSTTYTKNADLTAYVSKTGDSEVVGNLTATSFVKSGGTATQLLMADGSTADSTTYTKNDDLTSYVSKTGDSAVVGNLTATSLVKSGGTTSQFLKADGSVDVGVGIWDIGTIIKTMFMDLNPVDNGWSLAPNDNYFYATDYVLPYARLTEAVGNKTTIMYCNSGAYTNWEIRARIYMTSGADGIWISYGNSPISSTSSESSPGCYGVFFNHYNTHSITMKSNGVQVGIWNAMSYNLANSDYRDVVFKKIGSTLTVTYAGQWTIAPISKITATVSEIANLSYFSIGARTGGSSAEHRVSYMEIRGW
jgi:hypothetical protein